MRKISTLLVFCLCICLEYLNAQENFQQKYGFNPKIVTLSKGKYPEFHDNDTIVEIGSALFNTKRGKIVGKLESKLLDALESDPHVVSRWMAIDPLAEEYWSWSPYNYVADNPILFIDPNGESIDLSWILATNKDGSYKNEELAQGFLAFAQTDFGMQFLTAFAEKGQGISELGIKFEENGFMHDAGMDLSFKGEAKGEAGANGEWNVEEKNGRFEGQVILNTDLNWYKNDAASDYAGAQVRYKNNKISKEEYEKAKAGYSAERGGTIVHELGIHGIYDMMSIRDGGGTVYNAKNEHQNARKQGSWFRRSGLPAIYQIHKLLKTGKSKQDIEKEVFNYQD